MQHADIFRVDSEMVERRAYGKFYRFSLDIYMNGLLKTHLLVEDRYLKHKLAN